MIDMDRCTNKELYSLILKALTILVKKKTKLMIEMENKKDIKYLSIVNELYFLKRSLLELSLFGF